MFRYFLRIKSRALAIQVYTARFTNTFRHFFFPITNSLVNSITIILDASSCDNNIISFCNEWDHFYVV